MNKHYKTLKKTDAENTEKQRKKHILLGPPVSARSRGQTGMRLALSEIYLWRSSYLCVMHEACKETCTSRTLVCPISPSYYSFPSLSPKRCNKGNE
jgi:hypothetical protein